MRDEVVRGDGLRVVRFETDEVAGDRSHAGDVVELRKRLPFPGTRARRDGTDGLDPPRTGGEPLGCSQLFLGTALRG